MSIQPESVPSDSSSGASRDSSICFHVCPAAPPAPPALTQRRRAPRRRLATAAAEQPAVRFVDYADAAAGRGALDIAGLLASAMDPDDRHANQLNALLMWPRLRF